mmetsp:Transcript_16658/g.33583  ORF Transcript_16658/g.33583 Transcript_16658/m.33583 type:complete len:128 (+) Transcript_16658:36-419(+)
MGGYSATCTRFDQSGCDPPISVLPSVGLDHIPKTGGTAVSEQNACKELTKTQALAKALAPQWFKVSVLQSLWHNAARPLDPPQSPLLLAKLRLTSPSTQVPCRVCLRPSPPTARPPPRLEARKTAAH